MHCKACGNESVSKSCKALAGAVYRSLYDLFFERTDGSTPTAVHQFLSRDLSRKFWSGENFGPGDQNSRKIGPPGPLFPENLGPAVE